MSGHSHNHDSRLLNTSVLTDVTTTSIKSTKQPQNKDKLPAN